ncbi:MAG: selenide, water dikinase SelD [Acidobacteriota bacterium]
MPSRRKKQREVVLVGGGHSHVQVLRGLAMEPLPEFHLTVVLDTPIAVYSGMVPGFVAGQYRAEELEIDVLPLARRAGARVILSAAVAVDAAARRIELADRPSITYDVASFDIGSTVAGLDLPGVCQHALPSRPIGRLVQRVEEVVERVGERPAGEPFRIVVAGGGAGGVEMAFALWQRLGGAEDPSLEVHLVQGGRRLLPGEPESLVRRARKHAVARSIRITTGQRIAQAEADRVVLEDGRELPCELLVWVVGATARDLFTRSGLATDDRGFVWTRPTLQVRDHDDLFAVGDCATLLEAPRTPKAGVYAVRQGPYLLDNLRAFAASEPLRRYRPQSDFLSLLNLGDGEALGTKGRWSFEGRWVMRLKDWIDRRFMDKFQVLDAEGALQKSFEGAGMGTSDSASGEMECGGCAAKIGQTSLARALARLPPAPADPGVFVGLDRPDDAAIFTTRRGDRIVSTIDAFRSFTDDPFLVGRVAAVNALSDLWAKGAHGRHAQALVALPSHLPSSVAEEMLYQVLAGARVAFDAEGVTLLGGHTTTGPELLVGFAVDGELSAGRAPLTLDLLESGQELILTKGLGTGVLLQADMQGRLRGRWLESAISSMVQSNARAAEIAVAHGATAMTDITGFGLAGHLLETLRASGVSAQIDLDAVPALPGAIELLGQGIRSTAHEENARAKAQLLVQGEAVRHSAYPLLFDPQTSGGLLFGVPAKTVEEVLDLLQGAGFSEAARIGTVLGSSGGSASPLQVSA